MNKYFIGYPVPEELAGTLVSLQHYIQGPGELIARDQLHITALYLGPQSRDTAEGIFQGMERRTLPILCDLDTYQRFGDNSLVVTLKGDSIGADVMKDIHLELNKLAGRTPHKNGYNPHITVAKGKSMFIKMGCPEKKFTVGSIALYEKQEGGEYHVHMVKTFR